MPGPTNISLNSASRVEGPEGDTPGFYRYSNEWHSKVTRRTYHWVGGLRKWVEVSDSRDFWDFCESHQRREPAPGWGDTPAYKSCSSCFHVWLTEDEFKWDIEYVNSTFLIPVERDEPICPHCSNFF